MKAMLRCLAVVVALAAAPALAELQVAFATVQGGSDRRCKFLPSQAGSLAQATFEFDNLNATGGWKHLVVRAPASDNHTNEDIAFAAGCVEGMVAYQDMFDYWTNYRKNEYKSGQPSENLVAFMENQEKWVREQAIFGGNELFVGLRTLLAQLDGLIDAVQQTAPAASRLTPTEIYMLNSVGDLEDLNGLLGNVPARYSTPVGLDCSGLVQGINMEVTQKGYIKMDDIVVGHTTWRDYYGMLRHYKQYEFSFNKAAVVSMSSSPGFLHSKDDFYATGGEAGLIVFETTNNYFHDWTPSFEVALSWQRAMVATSQTTSGSDWTAVFATANSGTYNNQWVVLDTKKMAEFDGQLYLQPVDSFWVAEQIPHLVERHDLTADFSNRGYWPSFNIPYYPNIYNMSGYAEREAKYGCFFAWDCNSRANIFRRNQTELHGLADVAAIMRYNNYLVDPLSMSLPDETVAARRDLPGYNSSIPVTPTPYGGIDTKVISARELMSKGLLAVSAINGPTHVQQPVFQWSTSEFADVPHQGLVDRYDFEFAWFNFTSPNL